MRVAAPPSRIRTLTCVTLLSVASFVLGACAFSPAPTRDIGQSPSGPSAEELSDARRFRESFGLRSDDAWIRAVAANLQGQAGLREYGVPLMPAELDLLEARADAFPEISEAAEAYGRRHAAEFGGVFVDHVQGTVAVFLTGQLETTSRRTRKDSSSGSAIRGSPGANDAR